MPEIRYKIPLLSVRAILACAKPTEDEDRFTFALTAAQTESTLMRSETLQDDNAVFFQAMYIIKGNDYSQPSADAVITDLADVLLYLDFSGIFDRNASRKKFADRQLKAQSMFRPDGITLDFGNGAHRYLAFERSASMSRNARLSFVREDVYTELYRRMTLGMKIGICQLSKLYAYNGLLFSSGTRIENPRLWNIHSIVVIDNPKSKNNNVNVITVEDETQSGSVRKYNRVEKTAEVEVIEFDGEGLISPDFAAEIDKKYCGKHIHTSFQIRMPYIKGMVHEVDFPALFRSAGIYELLDIWGNRHPADEVKMILTRSQLKGFGWLNESGMHWYAYLRFCEMNRHALYITNTGKEKAEAVTELNYQFLNTVSVKAEDFRPTDLPDGWNVSPATDERNWLTKATEQEYYNLRADESYRLAYFLDRAARWHFGKKDKNYYMARLLRKNPHLINEPIFADELDAMAEKVLRRYALGRLTVAGDNRFLSGDLIKLLYHLLEPYVLGNPAAMRLQSSMNAERFRKTEIYAPGAVYPAQEKYTLLRSPHIARNEEAMVTPLAPAPDSLRVEYLSHLTDTVMIDTASFLAERMGGADYDGDMVKTIAEPIVNNSVMKNYQAGEYDAFSHRVAIPLLQIPAAEPLLCDANDWRARFETVKSTFSSRVGQISNAALDRSIIAYDENADAKEKERCRRETETLAILTGLEIDSAKSGIKPDLSEYLGAKNVIRSRFLKYKNLLERADEPKKWYEPDFSEQLEAYFKKADWSKVSSNVERLPYLAYMLKKNTPKAKCRPAKASELFTFAVTPGWEKALEQDKLERLRALTETYTSCLRRIRANRFTVKDKVKRRDIDRILFMREEVIDADTLYAMFADVAPARIAKLRASIRAEKWHLMPEDRRTLFLLEHIPELTQYHELLSDFRCGGYRLLGDVVCDLDDIYRTSDSTRLHFDTDTPEMTALVNAYVNKPLGVTYRDAVSEQCRVLVAQITTLSVAVRYVVALGKRAFLWEVLLQEAEKYILKKEGDEE